MQAAVEYYRRVFGLVPTWMWGENVAGVTTELAPIELYFSQSDKPTPSRLAVFVDDADVAYARYRAAGAEIVEDIETRPWGCGPLPSRTPTGT